MLKAILILCLLGCLNAQKSVLIRGFVRPYEVDSYKEVFENQVLQIKILYIALQDIPAITISEKTISLSRGQQFPIFFEIQYPPTLMGLDLPDNAFSITAQIKDFNSNKATFFTDTNIFIPKVNEAEQFVFLNLVKNTAIDNLPDKDVCNQRPEPGKCQGFFSRYYYDASLGRCLSFIFGGCGGNLNKFDTIEECESKCLSSLINTPTRPETIPDKNACNQPAEPGRCLGYFIRYFFDPSVRVCREFVFGGCEGNLNRFETREECARKCYPTEIVPNTTVAAPTTERPIPDKNACNQQAETGTCKGYFARFFFDASSGKCKEFVWTGCGGNLNRFDSLDECSSKCSRPQDVANTTKEVDRIPDKNVCNLAPEPGNCLGYFIRYYFDPTSASCKSFVFGGCGGNLNRFSTLEECNSKCYPSEFLPSTTKNPACALEPLQGPCRALIDRFYFNRTTKSCETFQYGGCFGNANNFKDVKSCSDACV